VAALKSQDITISADQVKLHGPLKELGLYTVAISLHPSIATELKVWVVPAVTQEASK
jgi:large subunit ribosomal protein L9